MTNLILKNKYILEKKLKQDKLGWFWSARLQGSGENISAREYLPNFCHPATIEALQSAILRTAELKHPNIVRILDTVYTEDGRFFIIYDTPYQGSLTEIFQRIKKFPLYDSQKMILEIARAVEYAHQQHTLHGALSPENIDILANGEIKVRNFFIDHWLNSFLLAKGQNLLNTSYLTPEQIRGEPLTKATDVLALGALFYYLLAGRAPYPVITSLPQILKNYLREPEKLLILVPDTPLYIEEIIFKALQHNAQYRQQSITEFIGDLRQKKVTIAVEELKRRQAAGQLQPAQPPAKAIPPENSANPPDDDKIKLPMPPDEWEYRPRKRKPVMPETPPKPDLPPENKTKKQLLTKDNIRQLIYLGLLGVFVACLVLFINAIVFNYFNSVPQVEIPDILRLPREEGEEILKSLGLRSKFSGYINSAELTPNHIIIVNPEPGRKVKKDRIIRIYASQQALSMTAPNLIEHTLQSAIPLVADRGVTINVVDQVFSNRYARQQIISQTPEAGEEVKHGEKINVVISKGYPVFLTVRERTATNMTFTLAFQNEPSWEPQNVIVYLQDRRGRHKYAEKFLRPGDKDRMEITTDLSSIVEVYYFNDLAFKEELRYLESPVED